MANIISILLVEDNPGDIRLIKEYLKENPLTKTELFVEKTLESAINVIRGQKFDVILLDLNLPDSNGLNTYEKISEFAIDLPIIILSGLNDNDFTLKIMTMGAQDYLTKDYLEPILLIRTIQHSIERKKGELALKKAQEELKSARDNLAKKVFEQTQDLYRQNRQIETILETIPDGILVLDCRGKIILANSAFRNIHRKLTTKEIYENFTLKNLLENQENDDKSVFDFYSRVFKIFTAKDSKETENLTIEPSYGFHIQLISKRIFSQETKEYLGIVFEFRDVSAFVEFEKIRRQFISTVSHELRTPITAINLGINNLKKYWKNMSEGQMTNLIISIDRGAKNLSEITEDLLILSRMEEDKIVLNMENCSLFELIFEILIQLRPNFDSKKINSVSMITDLSFF